MQQLSLLAIRPHGTLSQAAARGHWTPPLEATAYRGRTAFIEYPQNEAKAGTATPVAVGATSHRCPGRMPTDDTKAPSARD